MTIPAKQSTAKTVLLGPVLDTDGLPSTGALAHTDFKIFKNGTDTALNASATATHKYEGVYAMALTTSDLGTLGIGELILNKATLSAAPVRLQIFSANVYDSFFSTDKLQVDAVQILGTTLTESVGGYLAAAFKKLFDVAAPVLTATSVNQSANNNTILANATYGLAKLLRADTPANAIAVDADGRVDISKLAGSSANLLMLGYILTGHVTGTCGGNTTMTVIESSLPEATADHYNGSGIFMVDGPAAAQRRIIIDYTSTTITVDRAFTDNPGAGAVYVIVPDTDRINALTTAGKTAVQDEVEDGVDVKFNLSAGVVESNVVQIGGVVQSLTDFKDFVDTGYNPATHKVAGVLLTDTVTTYTGNTVQTGDAFARLGAPAGASVSADIADVPTVAEMNARTIVSADYFDPGADTVVLGATGLDAIPTTEVGVGVPGDFREVVMAIYEYDQHKHTMVDDGGGNGTYTVYNVAGAAARTQSVTDDATTQTVNAVASA